MRILVCGGRDFLNFAVVVREMSKIRISAVIEGGAPGADSLGRHYADIFDIPTITFRADWKRHGRAAGPLRNQKMLDEGRPDRVIAFPGGRGTADMVRRAKAAGVEVHEVS